MRGWTIVSRGKKISRKSRRGVWVRFVPTMLGALTSTGTGTNRWLSTKGVGLGSKNYPLTDSTASPAEMQISKYDARLSFRSPHRPDALRKVIVNPWWRPNSVSD